MRKKTRTKTAEHRLVEWIRDCTGSTYIGDDCAVLPGGVLVTSDTLVEGTHFLRSLTSFGDLGWKAVASNLSDIAAMAGRPEQIIVNLTLPPQFTFSEFRKLYSAMVDCARLHKAVVAGGDLTRGPLLVITLTVIGKVNEHGCLRRSGAKDNDVVVVTGDFGASAAGLWALRSELKDYVRPKQAHLRPEPRLKESWELVALSGNRGSLMDASDGLVDALVQISRASGVGMEINPAGIPIHEETCAVAKLAGVNPLDWALYGGEDYELVGTIPEDIWESVRKSPHNPFTAIGRVTATGPVILKGAEIVELDLSKSFQHWNDLSD